MTGDGEPLAGSVTWDDLVVAATAVRDNAYAPFTGYRVGSALLTADGTVYAGCNVETRHLPISVCAERSAMTTAVSEGKRDLVAIAVVTDSSPPAPPCGMCLEFLREHAPRLPILMANTDGERIERRLDELLPFPFELRT